MPSNVSLDSEVSVRELSIKTQISEGKCQSKLYADGWQLLHRLLSIRAPQAEAWGYTDKACLRRLKIAQHKSSKHSTSKTPQAEARRLHGQSLPSQAQDCTT